MSECLKVCEEIIEAGKRAAPRPWDSAYLLDAIIAEPDDATYIAVAANNAVQLAQMVLKMARDYPDAQGRLERIWEQSK